MLHILAGPDDFSLAQSLEEIKRGMGDQAILATSTSVLDGQQVTLEQLKQVCETVPFLAEKRLVVIRGLLGRFEPRVRPRRQKKTTASTEREAEYRAFASCITQAPESTVVVLIEDRIADANPLLGELSGKAKVRSFPLLKDVKLRQWVQGRVAEEGGSLSTRAAELLTRLVGSNLWVMASEINKLVLYTSGRRIEEGDVKAVVSYDQQGDIFTMIDAIFGFKAEAAEKSLEQLLLRGTAPAYILFMLSRQIQRIIRARELINQRKPRTEIQNRLGLTSGFAMRRTLEQAGGYSLPRLKAVYHQLLDTDLSIKTGRLDAELALNILVAELCQRDRAYATNSS